MNHSFYASLLSACSQSEGFEEYLKISAPEFKVLFSSSRYSFICSFSQFIALVPGDVISDGKQLMMKPTPKSSFRLLKDFRVYKQAHSDKEIIGVGYSNGANLVLALADIDKTLKVICFNPLGLGKKLQDTEFFKTHQISPKAPTVDIYKIRSNELSQSFLWPTNNISLLESKLGLSPHSLHNFESDYEVKIEQLSKIYPTISMITFNSRTGFMLIETEKSLNNYFIESDLATVFYSVYTCPEDFSFTLVPADKLNPSGPFQRKVFSPESLEGTVIGNYLWEADWKLKQMDLGLWYDDLTGQTVPVTVDIEWFKSGFDFYCEEHQEGSLVRLWFVMEKVDLEYWNSDKGVCVKPKKVGIKVQARKLMVDSGSAFGLGDSEEYHTAYKFAEYLNGHMEELCEAIPEVRRLKELSVLVAIAKFFRDDLKVPKDLINLEVLKSRIQKVEDFYEKNKVPRISRKSEFVRGENMVFLNVTGGVSMISQRTVKVSQGYLIEHVNRGEEILTPFYLSHYDYMKGLLEYEEVTDDEYSGFIAAFELCKPVECSDPQCNNFVIIDCKNLNFTFPIESINQFSPYSHAGKLYCKDHHPFRCHRKLCRNFILPGESYAELEFGKFHSYCILCEKCLIGITSSFVYEDGFWHVECIKDKEIVLNRLQAELEKKENEERKMKEKIFEEKEREKGLREREEMCKRTEHDRIETENKIREEIKDKGVKNEEKEEMKKNGKIEDVKKNEENFIEKVTAEPNNQNSNDSSKSPTKPTRREPLKNPYKSSSPIQASLKEKEAKIEEIANDEVKNPEVNSEEKKNYKKPEGSTIFKTTVQTIAPKNPINSNSLSKPTTKDPALNTFKSSNQAPKSIQIPPNSHRYTTSCPITPSTLSSTKTSSTKTSPTKDSPFKVSQLKPPSKK